MSIFLEIFFTIIILGSLYTLVTVGFSLIYSVTKILHISHGSVVIVSAYAFISLMDKMFSVFLAIIFAIIISILCGFFMNLLVYENLRRKRKINTAGSLIASVALLILVQNILLAFFGPKTYSLNNVLSWKTLNIAGALLSVIDIIIIISTFILITLLYIFLKCTKLGIAVRACADNEVISEIVGINTKKIRAFAFVIGSALAGISGVLFALKFSLEPNMSTQIAIKFFARSIVGGIGSLPGAIFGNLIIEFAENVGAWFLNSSYKNLYSFIIVFIFLLIRPQGIFGSKKD